MISFNQRLFFWLVLLGCLLYGGSRLLPAAGALSDAGPAAAQNRPIISEFVTSNGTGLVDEDGDFSDWIELYNPGPAAINLAGWALSDDPARPDRWPLPDKTLAASEHLLLFASGKDRRAADGELHTNFKLSATGGELPGLHNLLDTPLSGPVQQEGITSIKLPRDVSYGWLPGQQQYGYMIRPTPGQPNDESAARRGLVAAVQFSIERGIFEGPVTVALSSTTPGAAIRYTTDGSTPTEAHGIEYTGPLTIDSMTTLRAAAFKPDFLPAPASTHTYIFLADVLRQPNDPPDFPSTWGVYTKEYADNRQYESGEPVPADYAMDPQIVDNPQYRDKLLAGLTAIPSLSLVTEQQHFVDLYSNPQSRGRAWERPVSVELIVPEGSQSSEGSRPGFQIDAGLRIQGGAGRREYIPKHSFRLFFRGEYGASRLNYPLFPDSPVDMFETVVLRGGVNRSYAGKMSSGESGQHLRRSTYTRDEWLRASQIAMSGVGSHGIFVHLYINGLYWGLYNVIERPDAAFTSAYLGGQKEAWFAANHDGPISGNSRRFDALHRIVDPEQLLLSREQYTQIQSLLDLPQFIDYLILNMVAGNDDWANNNWYAGVRNPNGKVNYFVWDGEKIWEDGPKIELGRSERLGQRNLLKPLVTALSLYPEFELAFSDRLYRHLFNDGALSRQNAQARWLEINEEIEYAIVAESARWGDVRFETPVTVEDWQAARDDVLAQMENDFDDVLTLARQVGYPEIDPPLFNRQGGLVSAGFTLDITNPGDAGVIYYTTDGSDPRAAFLGVVAPAAVRYQAPLVITQPTRIKARVQAGTVWSALNEAAFTTVAKENGLRITEIMYNPADSNAFEFIELQNTGATPVAVAGAYFEGINFIFPAAAAPLRPGQVVVLVNNPVRFAQRYPDVTIGGVYGGRLSNGGEIITLRDAGGQVLISATFSDDTGWPQTADGRGDSLVLVAPDADPTQPKSWRAGRQVGGSPGVTPFSNRGS